MKQYVEQYSDLVSVFEQLRGKHYPFFIVTHDGKAKTLEWNQLNSFFHAIIVPMFSEHTGYTRKEAKEELQKLHALIRETDHGFDVESISGMSYDRLVRFVDACSMTLVKQFGVYPDKNDIEIVELIKTKTIKK